MTHPDETLNRFDAAASAFKLCCDHWKLAPTGVTAYNDVLEALRIASASISAPGAKERAAALRELNKLDCYSVKGATIYPYQWFEPDNVKIIRDALSAQPADALPDHFRDLTKMVLTDAVTVQDLVRAVVELATIVNNTYMTIDPHESFSDPALEKYADIIAACRAAEVRG